MYGSRTSGNKKTRGNSGRIYKLEPSDGSTYDVMRFRNVRKMEKPVKMKGKILRKIGNADHPMVHLDGVLRFQKVRGGSRTSEKSPRA